MTSKQRVLTSLAWRDPDRVPIQTYLTPEIRAQLDEHFGGRDLLECLGVDFRRAAPKYRGAVKPPRDGLVFDMWGTGYKQVRQEHGAYDEATVLPLAELATLDDVEAYPWPSPDDFDYSDVAQQCDAIADYAVCCGGADTPDILNGVSRGRGMEQVMIDVATRDPVGMAIIERRCEILYEVGRRTLTAGRDKIDILQLGEDLGNQNGRMFGPRDFDEVFRPVLKQLIDLAHEFGAKAMLHSCGDTHEIMPDLIDMGLDVLDAMQPEPRGMDAETIRAACRGKLAFCGLISTQRTLPFGTVADCRAEARHRLDVIAPGGGYIFSPAHCIQAGTPLQNVLAVYEEALGQAL
ncbi:MAG TPA: uroporphyrinogen decarboxylase family protein [Phycisphaerae bacterium]|nr:uroporphyrinogen decarboxylase family protein [Phycisphaerae bacterium]